ncbi:hypothetical protein AVEN_143990-1, partial [Araneus ventricosus]
MSESSSPNMSFNIEVFDLQDTDVSTEGGESLTS